MGITGLIPFLEKASRKANISEFSGCSVAIDSYCWLHKGAFACADKLVRGEETDIHIKYCMKYVNMLLSKNIKPILVFDGRHLPAKAMTEAKRRESRNISKKRAAELLALGKTEEARTYMRRSVDITHSMALALMKECRRRNVDCIVAPYEADAQLAYLNIKNIAHVVITEDSDLLLFGCNKVFFKMDLDGAGTLVEAAKLPLVMRCPIERYSFDKFRQMCIMSGCDYLASLPGIGLAKARQFIIATHDPNIANALKKLPSFFNKSQMVVNDEYRESFLKAEATFKHQYVYCPLTREMVRLNETDDEETEIGLCCNAGGLLEPDVAFQLALGNLDPFTLKKMDDWHPDDCTPNNNNVKTDSWKQPSVSTHCSIWKQEFANYLEESHPWQKKTVQKLIDPILIKPPIRAKKKVVNLINKYVPETEDICLTIENLSTMYCVEPEIKKPKLETQLDSQETQNEHDVAMTEDNINANLTQPTSPILKSKIQPRKLSSFPRTVLGDRLVESKFFNTETDSEEMRPKSPILTPDNKRNPFRVKSLDLGSPDKVEELSQKENLPESSPESSSTNLVHLENESEDFIENTYPMEELVTPVDSQESFGETPPIVLNEWRSKYDNQSPVAISKSATLIKKSNCKVPGLKKPPKPLPSNQPTLLSKFGFQKRPAMKK